MLSFKSIPFVRILIPFLLGIYFAHEFNLAFNSIWIVIVLSLIFLAVHMFGRKPEAQLKKWSYLFLCDVFLFFSAAYCVFVNDIRNEKDFYGYYVNQKEQVWTGRIIDLPKEKSNFFKVRMQVTGLNGPVKGELIAYFKKPLDTALIQPWKLLKVNSKIIGVASPMNPDEFNYKEFLARKNIYFQSFIESANIQGSERSTEFSLIHFGLRLKARILSEFRNNGLDTEAAKLCSSLITGYDDDMSNETINAFAHSGTLHVLSVSGLHTGIIYAVLVFFLGFIDKHKRYKFLHLVLVGAMLFTLTLITGFSAPVLRACIMLLLLMIGKSYFNYSSQNSINIIAVSAFLILLYDPILLYDVGFLLSYFAVVGIIYFEPYFSSLLRLDNYFLKKIWQLISVSISAQLSTLPLTLYMFHQFPLWFIVSNLIVIPLCTLVMLFGFVALFKVGFVIPLINYLCGVIFYFVSLTDTADMGYIDNIHFTLSDFLFVSSILVTLSLAVKLRTYIPALTTLILIIAWQMISMYESYCSKADAYIGIYHINKNRALEIKNRNHLLFKESDSVPAYPFHVKPHQCTMNYPEVLSFNADYVSGKNFSFFHLKEQKQATLVKLLAPRFILISDQPELSQGFWESIRPKLLIADGSNSYRYIKQLKEKCLRYDIPFYSTRENGYLQLDL